MMNKERNIAWLFDFFAFISILLIMIPTSLDVVVQRIGLDQHPLGFFIGPALYSYGSHLIPNIDYFTQYGTGLGAFFSFFLNESSIESFKNVVVITIVGTVFFSTTYYFCSLLILNSRAWSYCLTLIALMLNFFGPAPLRGPSNWPIRYPFLALFCLLYLFFCKTQSTVIKKSLLFILGLLAGISFFWSTEIGLYIIAIGAFCFMCEANNYVRGLSTALLFVVTALLTFVGLCLLASGTAVLSMAFVIALFKPALLYGAGFGYWPVNWLAFAEYLPNVLIPILLVATVIWTLASGKNQTCEIASIPKQQVLLLISLLSLAQLIKYWNMSLAAVWFSNAYLPLLIFAFWLRVGIKQFAILFVGKHFLNTLILKGLPIAALIIGISYTVFFRDSRMDFEYGIKMYKQYPSVLMQLIGYKLKHKNPILNFSTLDVSDRDVALIVKLVAPGERAFIYSSKDWAYLLKAKRAPGFPVIPSSATALLEQGEEWQPFLEAKIIFIDIGTPLWGGSGRMNAFIQQKLKSEFVLDSVSDHLKAYRRIRS